MDGLLLDTEIIYTQVTQEIVSRFGKTYEWSLKSRMLGQRAMEAATLLVNTLQLPITPEEYLEERNAKQAVRFHEARPLPGVMKLVKHLKNAGIHIAVATSSHRAAYDIKVSENSELFELFDLVICGDNPLVLNGKPAPDIFLLAAKQLFATDPSKCLVFEDSMSGVQAAIAAKMPVCWIPDVQDKSADIEGVTQKLLSMQDFDCEFYGLPKMD